MVVGLHAMLHTILGRHGVIVIVYYMLTELTPHTWHSPGDWHVIAHECGSVIWIYTAGVTFPTVRLQTNLHFVLEPFNTKH